MEKFVRRPLVTQAISSHTAAALSSHDPSARPTIPRAWTRWKKASAARRQCFVCNTSKKRTREENTNISSQSRSCVGHPYLAPSNASPPALAMSIIQDKLSNEFLQSNGGMDPNFTPGMLMFSHLPPVTSFTRLASQSVMVGNQPQEIILKKERDSPPQAGSFLHGMGIKQEQMSELDYRMPLYGGGGLGGSCGGGGGMRKGNEMLEVQFGGGHHHNHQNMLLHDLSNGRIGELVSGRPVKGTKESLGRRRKSDGEVKARRKRGEHKMLDGEGGGLSPNSKPHICEHCSAAFRSSYHLRRHVLIHTGERPFRCSQCNMSFIQKYLLQRHEKIHSGEKPFSCDQCNMCFIQKYHMERHKRTHSGEKPYRCDTCQQFFSRTDRLLKHKRTCGEALKKGLDPSMLQLVDADIGHGSYSLTQGNATATSGRRRGKSKNTGEGIERKRKTTVAATVSSGSLQDYGTECSDLGPIMQGRTPKLVFKKNNKSLNSVEDGEQKLLSQKQGSMELAVGSGLEALGLLQGSFGGGAKQAQSATSNNYDGAMQFVKKRRYLQHMANNDYGAPSLHMGQPQSSSVIQGSLGHQNDPAMAMLDALPLDLKHHDKSCIPDEVLQSLLDHYSHKSDNAHHHHSDVTFDLTDSSGSHHVDLQPAAPVTPELDDDSPNGGDKQVVMSEYSKFLLQALERTSHSGPFPTLGPSRPFPLLPSSSSPTGPFFPDKHVYTSSPLECGYPPSISLTLPSSTVSSSSLSSSKSHYGILVGSPSQPAFHLNGLEAASHQQLTPSQELTEQLEKQHHSHGFQLTPQELTATKEQGAKGNRSNGSGNYADLDTPKEVDLRATYQIENFAQAFGSQFKSGRHTPLGYSINLRPEVDHRIRATVSEFSGFTSLLADVSEPVSTGSKTATSQSFR
ncbi:zinc finger protein 281 isoform X2 [Oncorhynchus kisutch]|uniref:Zinc finger protein 281 n=2 Tax=Oncorhynchus kisutch TaxID=8019 RepID=A0A8C7DK99_ONCKI|nr:zinc finger protein 281 isoform X2 [Oncorhynchus kisutch]